MSISVFDNGSQQHLGGKPGVTGKYSMIPKPVNIDLQQVPNQFQIWYTNAESLTNKMDELRARVNKGKVDAIVITETLPKHSFFEVQEQELKIKLKYPFMNVWLWK